ncbi:hypothetical protein CsatB_012446 [Cannabis sativa]
MGRCCSYFLVVILCTTTVVVTCVGHSQKRNHNITVPLFVLGDSIFDPGNNNYINTIGKANYSPYGQTFFNHPTGRFSDGRIIPDFIAEFAKLPLIPPYLHPGNHEFRYGVNFASAGSGAMPEINQGMTIDLQTQLRYFKNVREELRQRLGETEVKALLSRAVYLFSAGSNDYVYPFTINSTLIPTYSPQEYVGLVIGNISFKEGMVACCGSGPYRGVLSCGGKRGVKEYDLCENPSQYLFFDSGHLTDRAYHQFSIQAWSEGDSTFTTPCNLKALFDFN